MRLLHFFLKEGASGGTGGGTGEDPNAGKAPDVKPGEGDDKGGSGGGKEPSFEEKFKTLELENKDLKTKIGKQGNSIGLLNKLQGSLKSDPKSAIKLLAKDYGVKINFDEGKQPDLAKTLEDADPQKTAKTFALLQKQQQDDTLGKIEKKLEPIIEEQFKTKYADWDSHAETRGQLDVIEGSGSLSRDELLHFASRGLNMEATIKDAQEAAVEKFKADLDKKNKEQIENAGGGGAPSESDEKQFANVISRLPVRGRRY